MNTRYHEASLRKHPHFSIASLPGSAEKSAGTQFEQAQKFPRIFAVMKTSMDLLRYTDLLQSVTLVPSLSMGVTGKQMLHPW